MVTKFIVFLAIFATVVFGRQIQVSNNLDEDIIISVTGLKDLGLEAKTSVFVNVTETFMGRVTGVLANCTDPKCLVTQTIAEFTLSDSVDFYDISLIMGFNLPITITSKSPSFCEQLSCSAKNLLDDCPQENQVLVENQIVGCKDNESFLSQNCPVAIVDPEDPNFQSSKCFDGSYFHVIFEWYD